MLVTIRPHLVGLTCIVLRRRVDFHLVYAVTILDIPCDLYCPDSGWSTQFSCVNYQSSSTSFSTLL